MQLNEKKIEDDKKLFDSEKLEDMRNLFKDEFPGALNSFRINAQNSIQEIGEALYSNNQAQARSIAHILKSSAAMFGLIKVSILAEEIEFVTESANKEFALGLSAALDEAFQKSLPYLK